MTPSGIRHELALTAREHEVLCAVITKFAADLVLYRLAKPGAKGEAAALEDVATSAAIMLNDKREPTVVECLAVQAIMESVSTGASDAFYEELCTDDVVQFTPARLKHIVRIIFGKLAASGFRAAA
jgi:hypothetical protein